MSSSDSSDCKLVLSPIIVGDIVRIQGEELIKLRRELDDAQKSKAASNSLLYDAEKRAESMKELSSRWTERLRNIQRELYELDLEYSFTYGEMTALRKDLQAVFVSTVRASSPDREARGYDEAESDGYSNASESFEGSVLTEVNAAGNKNEHPEDERRSNVERHIQISSGLATPFRPTMYALPAEPQDDNPVTQDSEQGHIPSTTEQVTLMELSAPVPPGPATELESLRRSHAALINNLHILAQNLSHKRKTSTSSLVSQLRTMLAERPGMEAFQLVSSEQTTRDLQSKLTKVNIELDTLSTAHQQLCSSYQDLSFHASEVERELVETQETRSKLIGTVMQLSSDLNSILASEHPEASEQTNELAHKRLVEIEALRIQRAALLHQNKELTLVAHGRAPDENLCNECSDLETLETFV